MALTRSEILAIIYSGSVPTGAQWQAIMESFLLTTGFVVHQGQVVCHHGEVVTN